MPHLQTGFHPKLFTAWREGYGWMQFRADAIAALTVAIVALPLSMAIAIGSHVSPERGLYTAIIGGFLISALGGSRYPDWRASRRLHCARRFDCRHQGLDGLLLATMMAGVILLGCWRIWAGALHPLCAACGDCGFHRRHCVIIFASQIKDLFGLTLASANHRPSVPKLARALGRWPARCILWRWSFLLSASF